jgi:phosphoribosylaminoimidazole-succinocarboxamide synthase
MADYTKGELLYEGKAKRLYKTDRPDQLIMEFKDSLTAFDAVKKDEMAGKGTINNKVSALIMQRLNDSGIETNFIKQLDDNHSLVKNCEIIMIEVIVRYEAHGSFCRRYGVEAGLPFNPPLVEIGFKNDELHDPWITDDIASFMKLATRDELAQIRYMAILTGEKLREIYASQGIKLLDFKLEFGRYTPADESGKLQPGLAHIILADEVTPDTCRLVDAATGEKLDKDLFRFDLGDVGAGYQKLLDKMSAGSAG